MGNHSQRDNRSYRSGSAWLAPVIGVLVGIAGPPICRAALPLQFASQWGGPSQAVAVGGGFAYLGVGQRLVVLDLTDPANPVFVGQSEALPDAVRGVAAYGSYACVTLGWAGLAVLDISDPTAPSPIGWCDTDGEALDVFVDGDHAFVADGFNGLVVVNILDPFAPAVEGSCDTSGHARSVVVSGTLAYVADGTAGLQIIDVTFPDSPGWVGGLALADEASGVAVAGDYAYVAAHWNEGLAVVDVSVPSAPSWMGSCNTDGLAIDVMVSGNYAFVANGWNALAVVDVSTATQPTRIAMLPTFGWAEELALYGDYVFISDLARGMQVIDVTVPGSPVAVGGYHETSGQVTDVSAEGNLVYISDGGGGGGVKVMDASNPFVPMRLGSAPTHEFAWGLTHAGSFVYLADGCAGFGVVDVSDPNNPYRRGEVNPGCAARDIVVDGSYAYLAMDGGHGLRVIEISNPDSPFVAGVWEDASYPGYALGVAKSGDYAYLADADQGVQIISVFMPTLPTWVTRYDTDGAARDVVVSGDYAFVADDWMGVLVLDVSDPANPYEAGRCNDCWPAAGLFLDGTDLYVAAYDRGVHVVDVSSPATPTLMETYDTPGSASRVFLAGNNLYVADNFDGLVIFSRGGYFWQNPMGGAFGDPSNWTPPGPPPPGESATFNLPDAYTVDFDANYTNTLARVYDGTVTWDLAGYTYDLTGYPSLLVGGMTGFVPELDVLDGTLTGQSAVLGQASGSEGIVNVAGATSQVTLADQLSLGHAGAGWLSIYNNGSVSVGGSTLMGVAGTGYGMLYLDSGGQLNSAAYAAVGEAAGSEAEAYIYGPVTAWEVTGTDNALKIGEFGVGYMSIYDAGRVTNAIGTLATYAGSEGYVTIAGDGSVWENTNALFIGREGLGQLLVVNHGLLDTATLNRIGELPGSVGEVFIDGDGSRWLAEEAEIDVGTEGEGTLNIEEGGEVSARSVLAGVFIGADGDILVTGTDSLMHTAQGTLIGREGVGTLTVESGGLVFVGEWLAVGEQPGGEGWVTVHQGGNADVNGVDLGILDGSTGHLTVTDPDATFLSRRQIRPGYGATGTMEVSNGATVTSWMGTSPTSSSGIIGSQATAVGTVTIRDADSTWSQDGTLNIGWYGSGMLNVESGGLVESADGIVARYAESVGQATITGAGSRWSVGGSLSVGGTMTAAGGTGTVNVQSSGAMYVGDTLLLWPDGRVNVVGGRVAVGAGLTAPQADTMALHADGTLAGTGTVQADVVADGGQVTPGSSIGRLTIDGDFTQAVGSVLRIEIGGTDPLTEHDVLIVTGAAQLNGTLAATLTGGFMPVPGDRFEVVTATSVSGPLASADLPEVPGLRHYVDVGPSTAAVVVTYAGDLDGDGDVDLTDYVGLADCLNGPNVSTPPPGCTAAEFEAADLDFDDDVDLGDFAMFAGTFTG